LRFILRDAKCSAKARLHNQCSNRFVASAAAEKMAPVMTLDYLKAEAQRGRRNDFERYLSMVSDVSAPDADQLKQK
jgi:hypothetical protein